MSNGVGVENISACYPRPHLSQHGEPDRSSQNGEYGAEGFSPLFWSKMPSWGCTGHGKENAHTGTEYAEIYANLSKQFAMLKHAPTAFSGGVYDCWTDVETECDGFLSYDRVLKVPVEAMRAANALLTDDPVPPPPPPQPSLLQAALMKHDDEAATRATRISDYTSSTDRPWLGAVAAKRLSVDQRVELLVGKMTQAEKVAQLLCVFCCAG